MTWIGIAGKLAEFIINNLSPKLREELVEYLHQFYRKAVASEGIWDDIAAKVLLAVVGESPRQGPN